MPSGYCSTISPTTRGGPIGFTFAPEHEASARPVSRSLLGGWVILASAPVLWTWFTLALVTP
ncbi:MAG: hypothetical protein HZB56_15140 [Deltaproteobacteria bacterium]|nr:hypothetical protein [Deltaproteobacteria bacterium]